MGIIIKSSHILFCLLFLWVGILTTTDIGAATNVASNESQYPADLWDRIRGGFALKVPNTKAVHDIEDSYVQHPQNFYRILERGERYLYFIIEEIERRGMPAEIALLPIVESAFDPSAKSASSAVGLWQFIPATGKSFGLTQNAWHDDRRDVIAGTNAALDYLQFLHKRFDSWEIAIAAYNWGQTAIKRAVKRNLEKGKPTSFHHLKLPDETRHHVFKLLALKNIIANPAWYDIQLKAIPNRPYFSQVKVDNHIDTAIVAKLAGITLDEFKALNPAYNRPIVKVLNESRTILLPVDTVEVFQERINSFDEPLMTWHIYTVKRGDGINTLAKNNGVSRNQLRKMNGLTQKEKLKHGQRILLPQAPIPFGSDISIVRKKPNPIQYKQRTTVYTVKKGDTLYGIARRYGLTIKQIKSWNDNNENLSIGQQLILLRT